MNRLITPSKPCAKSPHGEACIAQKQRLQARCLQPVHRRPTRALVRQPRTIQRRLHTNRQPARQLIHEAVLRRVFRPPQHNTSRQTRSMPTFQRSDKDLHKKAKAGAARAEVRQVRPGSRQGCAGCVIRYPNCYLVASQRPASAAPQRRHAATLHRRAPRQRCLQPKQAGIQQPRTVRMHGRARGGAERA